MYLILDNPETPLDQGTTIEGNLMDTVQDLAGRACPWLTSNLHRNGVCYVATNSGSPGRELYGRGFIVRHDS